MSCIKFFENNYIWEGSILSLLIFVKGAFSNPNFSSKIQGTLAAKGKGTEDMAFFEKYIKEHKIQCIFLYQ